MTRILIPSEILEKHHKKGIFKEMVNYEKYQKNFEGL